MFNIHKETCTLMCQINVLRLTKIHTFFRKLTQSTPLYFTEINDVDLTNVCMGRKEQAIEYSQRYDVVF